MTLNDLKKKILEKKELRGIPEDFLDKYIEEYKKKNLSTYNSLSAKNYNEKSKEFDDLKKFIRKKLREVHGVFAKNAIGENKKHKLLSKMQSETDNEEEILNKILLSHQSTFERIEYYDSLYKKIFSENGIKKVIDLGCGYNPFSYKHIEQFNSGKMEFVVIDINTHDSAFVQKYFDEQKIKGRAITMDLSDEKSFEFLAKESKNSDVCLMFKLLDSLESKKRGISAEMMKSILSKIIVVSFPLKTIGGKNQIKGQRKWFEKIKQNGMYNVEEFILGPEKYYVLKQVNF